jgi:hypothetical protein
MPRLRQRRLGVLDLRHVEELAEAATGLATRPGVAGLLRLAGWRIGPDTAEQLAIAV